MLEAAQKNMRTSMKVTVFESEKAFWSFVQS